MSRLFLASTDHLDAPVATITSTPLAICVWFKDLTYGGATSRQLVNVGQAGTGNSASRVTVSTTDTPLGQSSDTAGATSSATSLTDIPNGTSWNVLSANFTSATSRDIYWNGTHKASNATSRVQNPYDSVRVSGSLGGGGFAGGLLAHVAYWSNALSDEEHRLLSCYTPNLVRFDLLIDYWDLIADGTTFVSTGPAGTTLTATGSKFSLDNPSFAAAWPYKA